MGTGADHSAVEKAFKVWIDGGHGNRLGRKGAVIKLGRDVLKTAVSSLYGDPDTGEIKKQELRFRSYNRRAIGPGFDFDDPDPRTTWFCENEEIQRLTTFLSSDVAESGRYRLVDTESPLNALLELLGASDVDVHALAEALINRGEAGRLVEVLAQTDSGLSAAQVAVIAQRRSLVARLNLMIQDPSTTETQIQRLIGEAYWVFGGRYVGVADRRNLVALDQHDIPLLTADGTLHIIELKGSNIPGLVRRHRNHFIVGSEIHEAAGQAMNYIRGFDEQGASLSTTYRNELGKDYDLRRVFATVVVGHPKHCRAIEARHIQQTIRSYNGHLSRVEVMTYKDLADTAERALAFEAAPLSVEDDPEQIEPWASPRTPSHRVPTSDPWVSQPNPWEGSDEPPV